MKVTTVCKRLATVTRFDSTKINTDSFGTLRYSHIMCENCLHYSSRGCKLGLL